MNQKNRLLLEALKLLREVGSNDSTWSFAEVRILAYKIARNLNINESGS